MVWQAWKKDIVRLNYNNALEEKGGGGLHLNSRAHDKKSYKKRGRMKLTLAS